MSSSNSNTDGGWNYVCPDCGRKSLFGDTCDWCQQTTVERI